MSASGRGRRLTSAAPVNKTDGGECQKELPLIFETGRLMEGSRTLNKWTGAKGSGSLKGLMQKEVESISGSPD